MAHAQPNGHLAIPPGGEGRPVLVLHAWWGLNDTVKTFCARLAEAGFIAFAPDLYNGKIADTIDGAKALSSALDADRAKADVANAATFLDEHAGPAQG